jgi:hypothetical protein
MEMITFTRTNDKELHVSTDLFFGANVATQEWNKAMLQHEEELLQIKQVKKRLKKDGLFFTFTDGFGRKWALEMKRTKITTS